MRESAYYKTDFHLVINSDVQVKAEDIDLTRSIHRHYLTLYYPEWTIVHAHAQASYKNRHMLWVHIQNLCRYFNKWGWFFDPERRAFNKL